MADFNRARLTFARRRRGLTKAQLAESVGVSVRMISAYESGEHAPGIGPLAQLARVLRFNIDFFGGDEIEEPLEDGTSFRALTSLSARQKGQALTSGALGLLLDDWIEERFVLPEANIPRYQGIDAETAAAAVRGEWGLGERSIRSMIHLLESQGVRVYSLPEECASIDAFSFWRNDRPYIFLNTRKSAEHSRMDAAHELGHLVLHWKGAARGREAEHEAAQFGSVFLMPSGSLVASAPVGGTLQQIITAKQIWGVSAAALAYRMHHAERPLLTEWQYRMLFMEMNRKGYLKAEPRGLKPETSQVLAKVLQALRDEGMSKAELAKELRISEADLDEVVFGLVLTSVDSSAPSVTVADAPSHRPALHLVKGQHLPEPEPPV